MRSTSIFEPPVLSSEVFSHGQGLFGSEFSKAGLAGRLDLSIRQNSNGRGFLAVEDCFQFLDRRFLVHHSSPRSIMLCYNDCVGYNDWRSMSRAGTLSSLPVEKCDEET